VAVTLPPDPGGITTTRRTIPTFRGEYRILSPRTHPLDGRRHRPVTARREVELPAALVLEYRRISDAKNLPSRSGALYNALADGVRLAATAEGRTLLPRDPGRRGGEVLREKWTQDPAEYRAWVKQLKDAGSSPRAVLEAWMAEYVRVMGNLPAMHWPFPAAGLAIAV
jgi:hypothetical protein